MNKNQMFNAVGEIDDDILLDTEEFLTRRQKGRKHTQLRVKWAGAAACFVIVLSAILISSHFSPDGDILNPAAPSSVPNDTIPSGEKNVVPDEVQPPVSITANINEIKEPNGMTAQISLSADDFVPMTYKELLEYFGAALPIEETFPMLKYIQPPTDYGYGIYKTPDRGVYYDGNNILFAGEDGKQSFNITLAKASYHVYDIFDLSEDSLSFTELNGRTLALFHYTDEVGDSCYYVEFLQNGIGYYVGTKNLSQDDFIKGLLALITEKSPTDSGDTQTIQGTLTAVDIQADYLGIKLDDGQEYSSVGVHLPEGEAKNYSLDERVEITYTGEPATICNIWKQQLVSVEVISKQ